MYRETNFDGIDILRVLFMMSDRPVSRSEITEKLCIGEGSVRTILDTLKEKRLLDSTQKGHMLSDAGNNLIKKIKAIIDLPKEITIASIYPELNKYSLLLRKHDKREINYKVRDVAVKEGSEGAMIFEYDESLILPGVQTKLKFKEIEEQYDLKKGDIVVVSLAKDIETGTRSALAVSLYLSTELGKILESLK